MPDDDDSEFFFEATPHDAAVEFIRGKEIVTREVFEGLLPELRARAFVISGIGAFDTLQAIRDKIAQLPAGADWAEVKRGILPGLHAHLVDDTLQETDPEEWQRQVDAAERRAELLVRTHGQQAYAASQWEIMWQQRDFMPWWKYQSMGDGHVRHSHRLLDGVILRHDDPFWQGHFPPWEFGCRCLAVPMTEGAVRAIQEEDAGKPPAEQRVLGSAQLKKLHEEGIIVRGPTLIADIRTPLQRGEKNPYVFDPSSLKMKPEALLKRYDEQTAAGFTEWAKKTKPRPASEQTVWEWLGGSEEAPTPRPAALPSRPEVPEETPGVSDEPEAKAPHRPRSRKAARPAPPAEEPAEAPQATMPEEPAAAPPRGPGEPPAPGAPPEPRTPFVLIEPEERSRLEPYFIDGPGGEPDDAPDIPAAIREHERDLLWRPEERGFIYTPEGGRAGVFYGTPEATPVPRPEILAGNIFTHQHPDGLPPSVADVEMLLAWKARAVRVATAAALYEVRGSSELREFQRWFGGSIDKLLDVAARLRHYHHWDQRAFDIQALLGLWRAAQAAGLIRFKEMPPPVTPPAPRPVLLPPPEGDAALSAPQPWTSTLDPDGGLITRKLREADARYELLKARDPEAFALLMAGTGERQRQREQA